MYRFVNKILTKKYFFTNLNFMKTIKGQRKIRSEVREDGSEGVMALTPILPFIIRDELGNHSQ